jgi:hypothetical protein
MKYSTKYSQNGGTLLFTLIALAVMLLSTISIYKNALGAVSTVGSYAFKESSVHAANLAVNNAITDLNSKMEFNTVTANYFPIQRKTTSDGLPCTTPIDTATTCLKVDLTWPTPITVGVNKVSYVIERLCKETPVYSNIANQCMSVTKSTNTGIKTYIFFRVTVKVTGANDTVSFVQATLPKQL